VPVETFEFATRDRDDAHDTVARLYEFQRPITYTGPVRDFEFTIRSTNAGVFGSDELRYGADAVLATAPFPVFAVADVLHGRVAYATPTEEVHLSAGEVVMFSSAAPMTAELHDLRLASVRIPMETVHRVAATQFGPTVTPVRFESLVPLPGSGLRQWQALSAFVRRSCAAGESFLDSSLVVTQLVDMIAATALAAFPNNTMTADYRPGPGSVGGPSLRRAAAFIESHAQEPITLADIAEAAGTSGRAVQIAFRRHYGVTPMGYLRDVRLEGVRRDLRDAEPTAEVTVAGVAAAWGFTAGSRFSEFYRQRFGQLPSQTLRS
jgi:AraC-like DNA-binding protein